MRKHSLLYAVLLSTVALVVAIWTAWGFAQGVKAGGTEAGPESAAALPAVPVTGACAFTKTKFKVNDAYLATTSTSFVSMDMGVTFTVSTPPPNCVEVLFSAEAGTVAGERMWVEALLDGAPSYPGLVVFAANDNYGSARTFQFIFQSVAAGAHSVKIKWASGVGGNVWTYRREVVVFYQ